MKPNQFDYFNFLFGDKGKDEYITIFATHKENPEITTTKHYKTITGAVEYANKIKNHWNVYVNLACTDGTGRATQNLTSRNVLAFDFDLKQMGDKFNHKDLLQLFQKQGLYYHFLVASGGGFHVYLKVDRTTDLDKLTAINKAMAVRLGADEKATLQTQVLRVPATYNHKYSKRKLVNGVFKAPIIHNYNMDKLHKQYVFDTAVDETVIKYIPTKNLPHCIERIMQGVADGERDFCLYRLVGYFKKANYTKAKTLTIIKEWNTKCNPPMADSRVEYHVNYCWDKGYNTFGCKSDDPTVQQNIAKYCDTVQCNKIDKFEKAYDNVKTVQFEYKTLEKIKSRGDKKMLNGNHLAVISVLKVHDEGLTMAQLEAELTPKLPKKAKLRKLITEEPKCIMSKPTRLKVMAELEELGTIEVTKGRSNLPSLYKIKDIKCLESEKLTISYHATQRFIDGAIEQSAFRLYCYMMYRLNKRENVVQEEVARDLGMTQQAVSKLIKELEEARFLRVWVDRSVNSLGANVYEWIL